MMLRFYCKTGIRWSSEAGLALIFEFRWSLVKPISSRSIRVLYKALYVSKVHPGPYQVLDMLDVYGSAISVIVVHRPQCKLLLFVSTQILKEKQFIKLFI